MRHSNYEFQQQGVLEFFQNKLWIPLGRKILNVDNPVTPYLEYPLVFSVKRLGSYSLIFSKSLKGMYAEESDTMSNKTRRREDRERERERKIKVETQKMGTNKEL